jgi:hypothetical protein
MTRPTLILIGSAAVIAAMPSIALAGMPSATLTDIAAMRLQTLSFFALVFFVSSWIVQRLWNGLSADFPRLPRLGYWRATSLVAIWGLLFLVVLTMISGARELLTPGAWEKVGLTYKLAETADNPEESDESATLEERRQQLNRLRVALLFFSMSHGGNLPASRTESGIAREVWRLPNTVIEYEYRPGLKIEIGNELLAFEPPIYSGDPLVLFTSGDIQPIPLSELEKRLALLGAPR